MEILQLKYFFESAKTESFAKTAEKYMVPSSSVSASVKRLEKELGCDLFDRSCNRIILNDNGRRLQKSLCLIFDELEQAVDSLKEAPEDTREIRMLVRCQRLLITDYIIEYKKKHPSIKFNTIFEFSETNYSDYDIIIDVENEKYRAFERFPLLRRRLVIKAAKDHPLVGKKLTFRQLRNEAFVSMGGQTNTHRALIRMCGRAGFTPNIILRSNDSTCHTKCVKSGIALCVGAVYDRKPSSSEIVPLHVTDMDEQELVCAYYNKQSAYGNILNFIDFLKSKSV